MLHADGPHAIFFRAAPHTIEASDGKNEEGRCCQAAQVALCATLSCSWSRPAHWPMATPACIMLHASASAWLGVALGHRHYIVGQTGRPTQH